MSPAETRAVKLVASTDYPAPVISSISPDNAQAGSSSMTISISGSHFIPCSKVFWSGYQLTTGYVSESALSAVIPSYLLYNVGAFPITVQNPEPGGGTSDAATFTVWVPNQPPVANDDSAETDADASVEIAVLSNDYDPEGQPVSLTGVTNPCNGEASVNANSTIRYTPNSGFIGSDWFQYTIADNLGLTATATVTVEVKDLNANKPPVAVDDSVRTGVNTPITIRVLRNDSDPNAGDTISLNYVYPAEHGMATDNEDGTVSYQPDPDFDGFDSFPYWINDSQGLMAQAVVFVEVSGTADSEAPIIIDRNVSPQWVAAGDAVHVEALAIDDVNVAGMTANGVELQLGSDNYWYGTLSADAALDYHDVVFEARDASENYATDTGYYCTLRVVAVSTKALHDPIMDILGSGSVFCRFAVCGRVQLDDGVYFTIDDGSGAPVSIVAYEHTLKSGDFARVRGVLYPGPMPSIFVENTPRDITLIDTAGEE